MAMKTKAQELDNTDRDLIQTLRAMYQDSQNKLQALQAQNEAGQVEIDQLKARDTTNGRPLRNAREQNKNLFKKLQDKEAECNDLSNKLEASKQALSKEQAKLSAVKASHVDTVKYLKTKFDELEGKMNMKLHATEGDLHLAEFILNSDYDIMTIESIKQDVALARTISK